MRRKICWSLRVTHSRKTCKVFKNYNLQSTQFIFSQVFESSAKLKLELDESAPDFLFKFSLLESLCFVFFSLATGTHLYIFIVVSPIVTHFFSLYRNKMNNKLEWENGTYQWRTRSTTCIIFLMSSFALLLVSARIERDILSNAM